MCHCFVRLRLDVSIILSFKGPRLLVINRARLVVLLDVAVGDVIERQVLLFLLIRLEVMSTSARV